MPFTKVLENGSSLKRELKKVNLLFKKKDNNNEFNQIVLKKKVNQKATKKKQLKKVNLLKNYSE